MNIPRAKIANLEAKIAKLDCRHIVPSIEPHADNLDNLGRALVALDSADKVIKLDCRRLAPAIQLYADDLGQALGPRDSAELLVAAAFSLLYRAEGEEKLKWFAERCYLSVIEALNEGERDPASLNPPPLLSGLSVPRSHPLFVNQIAVI
jgi:hypothetical protein